MTIEQRQAAAEKWANARADWEAADEQAERHDRLRVEASMRMERARKDLENVASIGPNVRTRVFVLPREVGSEDYRIVKVTFQTPTLTTVELLKTEPNE